MNVLSIKRSSAQWLIVREKVIFCFEERRHKYYKFHGGLRSRQLGRDSFFLMLDCDIKAYDGM